MYFLYHYIGGLGSNRCGSPAGVSTTNTVSFSESKDKAEIVFKKALKLCVPLAINGWVIYIILGEHIDFGLISAEKKETSLPLKDQVFLVSGEQHFLYLSNSGSRSVEIFSKTKNLIINLSLESNPISTDINLRRLVSAIISQVDNDGNKETIEAFIYKTIKEALNVGHGNLIAVCHENCFEECLDCMSEGIKLKDPIDIPDLLLNDKSASSNETSVAIKSKMSLVRSMINHDGIAFFSTNGKLLGFHYIIDNSKATKVESVGGARTKAFEALKQNSNIVARFFKSQDGNTKFE